MTEKYFDHLAPYEYRGHEIEARARHHQAAEAVRWSIRIGDVWYDGFPASFDETEADVRKKVETRVHEYLAGGVSS